MLDDLTVVHHFPRKPRDARCTDRWPDRPGDPCRPREVQDAGEDPGVAGGAGRPIRASPRLSIEAILAHIDFLDAQIERTSAAIEQQLAPFAPAIELLPAPRPASASVSRRARRTRRTRPVC